MTSGNDESQESSRHGLSRREFLRLGWAPGARGGDDTQDSSSPSADGQPLVWLGSIESLKTRPIGTTQKAEAGAPVYVVRVPEGILAVRAVCPVDDSALSWRPNEKSEDDLGERGRFYCMRDASIFDRRGAVVAGQALEALATVTIVQKDEELWADLDEVITQDEAVFQLGEGA